MTTKTAVWWGWWTGKTYERNLLPPLSDGILFYLKNEAADPSETVVNIYHIMPHPRTVILT
jgi:hypothetical protein